MSGGAPASISRRIFNRPPRCTKRCISTFALAAIVAMCCGVIDPSTSAEPVSDFVSREGTHFVLDGKPFFVAGINNHYLTFGSPREVTLVLDDAVAMGANVVRTFIQPIIGSLDGTTKPTVWKWRSNADSSDLGVHGTYMFYWDAQRGAMAANEGANGLQRLDFLVSEARKRNLRLIITFLDFWKYAGGAQQMLAWYQDGRFFLRDERTSNDYKQQGEDGSFFFRDERTRNDYKQLIRSVVERINPLTGRAYKDEPTIFAWELINEADIVQPSSLVQDWVAEMSAYVKSLDSRHLVSSGFANVYNRLSDIGIPTIDFGVWHGYPKYYNLTVESFDRLIREFCDIGAAHDKPVLLEEFGYARSNPDQVAAYRKWMTTIKEDPNCAGWIVWRLVSLQDSGRFPIDWYDQFDIHNDNSPIWRAMQESAKEIVQKDVNTRRP
jgi:mannan endo-1,4-beta-mannosidase